MRFVPQSPELILTGGIVHTMNVHDLTATAIAIRDGKVAGVGSDTEMLSLAGLGTVVETISGLTVIPGLIDAHNHLLATGRMFDHVQLFECRSIAEITQRIKEATRNTLPGAWIVGRGWDESLLEEGGHPTRHDLDPVSHGHPIVLHRVWNKLVANSAAMRAAGVNAETPDPPDSVAFAGSFERDKEGFPTGLFRDRAKELITSHIPAPTEADEIESIAAACRAYNELGITSLAEPGLTPAQTRVFQRAAGEHCLTVRVDMMLAGWGYVPANEESQLSRRFEELGLSSGFGSDLLRIGGIKIMPDGGIGDRTARVFEPYTDDPGNRGSWVIDPAEIPEIVQRMHDLGFAIDSHTCGDEAQQCVVEAYVAAQRTNPLPRLRHRVHHAYFPTGSVLGLMARYRIPAVVSNPFITTLGESFVLSLGEERASRAMPMRSYLDAGVPLASSSDSPVSDFNPWLGFCAATTRKTLTGRVLGAGETLSVKEALQSYTMGGAFAIGREREIGSLEPGKLADLVLLERDPLTLPPDDLKEIKPLAAMLGGRWVFDRR